MKNLGQMMKQAQEMQAKMAEMQERLAEFEVTFDHTFRFAGGRGKPRIHVRGAPRRCAERRRAPIPCGGHSGGRRTFR